MRGIFSFLVAFLLAAQVYAAPLVNSFISFPADSTPSAPAHAFDLSNITSNTEYDTDTGGYTSSPQAGGFNADGSEVFFTGRNEDSVWYASLSTEYDLSTIGTPTEVDVSTNTISTYGLTFSRDGLKMHFIDGTQVIDVYTLTNPFDISTGVSYSTSWTIPDSGSDAPFRDFAFNYDGTAIYVAAAGSDTIKKFDLSTAFDVTSASSSADQSLDLTLVETQLNGVDVSWDETKIFFVGYTNDTIYEYTMSTAGDLSTASSTDSYSVSGITGNPRALKFYDSGTRIILGDDTLNGIQQFILTAP